MQLRLNPLRACGRKSGTNQYAPSEGSSLSFKIKLSAEDCKHIYSQDCKQGYQLQKVPTLQKYHDYTWKLLGASQDARHSIELLAVTCDSIKGEVTLTKADGSLLTTVCIRHQSFFTVVKFKWQNSSYRWTMSRHAASRSMIDLKICLQQKGSPQNVACIEGAGSARKQCWVQLNELDTVSFLTEAKDPA
ncbi:hypothetical protein WJX82_006424 [Trebouxia sp. C0006]